MTDKTQIKCLIVEDEKPAQRILENYISKVPVLSLQQVCNNAIEAVQFLHHHTIDLIFLDINMPELSGFEMLGTLPNPPKVIVTTAYSDHALQGYEFGVVDYLLKPFSFQRFLKAVNRLAGQEIQLRTETGTDRSISIKDGAFERNISLSEIEYIESLGNYLKVHTTRKDFTIRETLKNMEEQLPVGQFLRIHRSFIVSIKKISALKNNHVIIGNQQIPIGNLYKSKLQDLRGS